MNTSKLCTLRVNFLAACLPRIPGHMVFSLYFGLAVSSTMGSAFLDHVVLVCETFFWIRCQSSIVCKCNTQFLDSNKEDIGNIVLLVEFRTTRTTRAARCPAFFNVCNLFLSVSNLSCRRSFLPSLDNLLDLNLDLMFFALRNPSLQSTWLFQRSVTVCCPLCCFCVTPFSHIVRFVSLLLKRFLDSLHLVFSTRLLSASQLQSSFQSQLGVLLLSRQPSILVLLPCVDDFQYLCFSSSVQLLSSRHCSLRTSRPAVGTAFCSCDSPLLLAMLFCHFVPLSEISVALATHSCSLSLILHMMPVNIDMKTIRPWNCTCDLRAPHRVTRPAFEAHPGATTFPPEVSSQRRSSNGPIRFTHHLFSDHDHGRQRSDWVPQHLSCPYVGLTLHQAVSVRR